MVEDRFRAALFLPLDLIPLLEHRLRVVEALVPENMGMSAHEFLGDTLGDIIEGETPLFGRNLAVHDDLQQQITQLLAQERIVALVDRLDHLVGFLNQVAFEAGMRLFTVPWAAIRCAQLCHYAPKLLKGVRGT